MRFALLGAALLALAACLPEVEGSDVIVGPGAAETDPSNAAKQQASCEAKGGTWRQAGLLGLMTCITIPEDAGTYCTKSTDCSSSQCLARSNTCAPVHPLFGCNDLLDSQGRTVSLCVD